MIEYQVVMKSPEAHLFEVTLSVRKPDKLGQTFYLPAWIRGSYMIRDFSRHIITLEASDATGPVQVKKLDKQRWRCAPASGPITLIYTVYAWELSVRAAHLDTTHAYFNGSSLLLGVSNQDEVTCLLTILSPVGQQFDDWKVVTSMEKMEVDKRGFGQYHALNYEDLLDHPVEIGGVTEADFAVFDVPHCIVISGRQRCDLKRLCLDFERMCSQHVRLFGELPVHDYLFLLTVVGDGYGGLEHRNSTSLLASRDDLPLEGMQEMTKGYRRLLGLCSHEYFHLWNIKRIMPAVFQEEGATQEVYTRQLWVFEGITSYYDELALVRSGCIDRKSYFELLAETVTRVMRSSGRFKQTLEESSFDAWTKFYKQDENAPNAIVSYYTKGAIFALVLDLHIRLQTDGEKSLDDVMREMWRRHGATGQGVPEGGFETVAAEVSGLDLSDLFDQGARSAVDLPVADLLKNFGVEMRMLPAQSSLDNGRVVDKMPASEAAKPVIGARLSIQGVEAKLLQVFDGGAAQAAGLSAGDIIIAVDHLKVNGQKLEKAIADCALGKSVTAHAFRRDEMMEFELQPMPAPADTCVFSLPVDLSKEHQLRQSDWLKSNGYED
ncbi:MAG: M61 family metallopeptidase [gamma proteobacterium endosymbiont of Lamellibrachia anaximandri]|nr:M61 family metallopeptidase [gamma proteobacterium endosymbiont of Lamellibrachia anaximandri]MBL3532794.1 M61 family metallopeptidase [gamma proteobacterium endosymbiont of Lamellibrachia anaximandri]